MICFEGFKTAFFEFSENPLCLIEVPSASGLQLLLDVIADLSRIKGGSFNVSSPVLGLYTMTLRLSANMLFADH